MPEPLPADVVRFIADGIDSVSLLDALLLLRAAPEKRWTPAEVDRALVCGEHAAREHLGRLRDRGLAAAEHGGFRYSPGPHASAIDDLSDAYAKRRHTVIAAIYGADSRPATTLADAFRIRRRKD